MPQDASRHIIIGTAGHVDHGKTTLIKALTGTDTDRLKEERERGMTIDLGFASFTLPGGIKVGIVDVPGHERFLKNMLAGATGVDVVLLVIAADEGVMPQTREHLDILELLEARKGVVALTKIDMVDPDWLDMVEDDVKSALKDSFLSNAPVLRVSATTGEGIRDLGLTLENLVEDAEAKSSSGPFRLPVDRVFTMTGFGTIVTGTLVSGTIRIGDPVRVLPEGIETRVRQLQVHGAKVQEVQAGTRVAINLAGVELSDLKRGSVLVPPGYLAISTRVDAFVRMLPGAPRSLKSRSRVRLHIGTAEHIGRMTVIGGGEIAPGQDGFIQFVSETPAVAARGDKFVLRSYSPMLTIGGGTVLDPIAPKHRASDKRVIETLKTRRKGEPADLLEDVLLSAPGPVGIKDAASRIGVSEEDARSLVSVLEEGGRVVMLEGSRIAHTAILTALESRIEGALAEFHRSHPLKAGVSKEELRPSVTKGLDQKTFGAVLLRMAQMGVIAISENLVMLSGYEVRLTEEQENSAKSLERTYIEAGLNPPAAEDAIAQYGEQSKEVFQYLVESGILIKIDEGLYLHKGAVAGAESTLRERLGDSGRITVSEFRDLTGSTRKFAVPLLEYFDSKRITRRIGDERVLVAK